jgi:proteasome assembly chaperone (PAC2) family protein
MSDAVELWEHPQSDEMYLVAGWRQWADGGSVSSGLPEYLIQQTQARQIGQIRPDGFYLFQFPGTHDLVRPVIRFKNGYPQSIETPENRLFYTQSNGRGIVIFLGDEPHIDIERYTQSFLEITRKLRVKRVIGLGGIYGEFPYEKERAISGSYSLRRLKSEMLELALQLTNYEGGASIGSYICRKAGERRMEYVGLYAIVPMFDFSNAAQLSHRLQIENDYMAWLAVMRRVNHMTKANLDLSDLFQKSQEEIRDIAGKIEELDKMAPQLGLREYFHKLSDEFTETPFIPLDDVWEENVRRILNKLDEDGNEENG